MKLLQGWYKMEALDSDLFSLCFADTKRWADVFCLMLLTTIPKAKVLTHHGHYTSETIKKMIINFLPFKFYLKYLFPLPWKTGWLSLQKWINTKSQPWWYKNLYSQHLETEAGWSLRVQGQKVCRVGFRTAWAMYRNPFLDIPSKDDILMKVKWAIKNHRKDKRYRNLSSGNPLYSSLIISFSCHLFCFLNYNNK